jgi:hypothetical protein
MPSLGNIGLAILALVVAWYVFRQIRRYRVDHRYGCKISGGRAGEIRAYLLGRDAVAEYEIGLKVDLLVYASSLAWASGEQMATEQKTQFIALLTEWSDKRGTSLVIAADA